jgi:hypothetical protein
MSGTYHAVAATMRTGEEELHGCAIKGQNSR